jgi:hypothetical protein
MSDCATREQAPGRRQPHYGSFELSLALPTAFIRRLFTDSRLSAPDRVPPPSRILGVRLDPAQVGAVAEAIRRAILGGARPIPSLWPRPDDPADWSCEDRPHQSVDQHLGYPPIQSLEEVGGARLFVPGSTLRRRDARHADGVCRYVMH